MTWVMEIDEIEAILEKIWDIHDKLSEAIHTITRTHFLNSMKDPKKSEKKNGAVENRDGGFVFVKDFWIDTNESAIQEAKSLNAIRTALENLEDQLEFFRTVQLQQRAERDTAIAQLEQSRSILAMRLAEHHGKKYGVIKEALAFVGNVNGAAHFISPENQYRHPLSPNVQNFASCNRKKPNALIEVIFSSINFAKQSIKLDLIGGILGNAAMFAVSMIALLHLHQVTTAYKELPDKGEDDVNINRNVRRTSRLDVASPNGRLNNLDVLSARG